MKSVPGVTFALAADEQRLRDFVEAAANSGDAKLPPEPHLSEIIGVSRGRLRTLLKRVEADGLIWRHVGKGTFAGTRGTGTGLATLGDSISVDEVIQARLLLEPQLAAEAAIHAKPADIHAMETCLREMREAPTFLQWRRYDEKLHRTVAEATHNALLLMLFDALRAQVKRTLEVRMEHVFGELSGPVSATEAEHADFVEAIRLHDPERAALKMREHIRSVRQALFGIR